MLYMIWFPRTEENGLCANWSSGSCVPSNGGRRKRLRGLPVRGRGSGDRTRSARRPVSPLTPAA